MDHTINKKQLEFLYTKIHSSGYSTTDYLVFIQPPQLQSVVGKVENYINVVSVG